MAYLVRSRVARLSFFTVFDSNASINFLIVGVTPLCSHLYKTSLYCSLHILKFWPMASSVVGVRPRYNPMKYHLVSASIIVSSSKYLRWCSVNTTEKNTEQVI